MPLLSVENAKTIKGRKYGYQTAILYLAPYNNSGHNICPSAHLAKCHEGCLFTAGRAARYDRINEARLRKTMYFHEDRNAFMSELVQDVAKHVIRSLKKNLVPLVRLNGTSDILWERIPVTYQGITYPNIMSVFPYVQFYDYTKMPGRRAVPANYDLTFSYSGVKEFQPLVNKARKAGMRIAVVFRDKHTIPSEYMGLPVVSGDNSDLRHLDPKDCIVALYAKGKAKHDNTGFVVDVEEVINVG